MIHTEGFLKLVNEAKTRIHEVSVEETLRRLSHAADALQHMGYHNVHSRKLREKI
jgi:hypothetical protein